MKMEQQKIRLELQKGVWCGFRSLWRTANAKILFDKLLHSSTNIENPGIGLNTQSGMIIVKQLGLGLGLGTWTWDLGRGTWDHHHHHP